MPLINVMKSERKQKAIITTTQINKIKYTIIGQTLTGKAILLTELP